MALLTPDSRWSGISERTERGCVSLDGFAPPPVGKGGSGPGPLDPGWAPTRGGQAQSGGPSAASAASCRQTGSERPRGPGPAERNPVCSGPPTSLGCETTAQEARVSVFLINNLFPLPPPPPRPRSAARPSSRSPGVRLRFRIPGALGVPGRGCPRGVTSRGSGLAGGHGLMPSGEGGSAPRPPGCACHSQHLWDQTSGQRLPISQPSDSPPGVWGASGETQAWGLEHPGRRSRHPVGPTSSLAAFVHP